MTVDPAHLKPSKKIDPDVLDLLIQSLSILSNVATLASTWIMLRGKLGGPGTEAQRDHIRQCLRTLRRALEDAFEAVESVLHVIEESERRDDEPAALENSVRFGHNVMLSADEFARVTQFLQVLDNNAMAAKNAARTIQSMALHTNLPDTIDIDFDTEGFVAQLNSVLFQSNNLAEATEKLRFAQQEAEDFVNDFERALRRN